MPLRIIIADDHPLLVEGLTSVLQEIKDVEVLEPSANGRVLIEQLRKTAADLVLLDLNMPKLDGIDTLKILKKEFPLLKIIVFSSYNQPKLIREIKNLGAAGYLPKSSTSVVIKEAVTAVFAGHTWFHDQLPEPPSKQLEDDFTKKYQITKREIEIIRMIAAGLTTREISEKLYLSEFTINTHRRNIGRKLNIYTPVGLLNFAKEQGLI
jgi:two-component system NarL family response regulator